MNYDQINNDKPSLGRLVTPRITTDEMNSCPRCNFRSWDLTAVVSQEKLNASLSVISGGMTTVRGGISGT